MDQMLSDLYFASLTAARHDDGAHDSLIHMDKREPVTCSTGTGNANDALIPSEALHPDSATGSTTAPQPLYNPVERLLAHFFSHVPVPVPGLLRTRVKVDMTHLINGGAALRSRLLVSSTDSQQQQHAQAVLSSASSTVAPAQSMSVASLTRAEAAKPQQQSVKGQATKKKQTPPPLNRWLELMRDRLSHAHPQPFTVALPPLLTRHPFTPTLSLGPLFAVLSVDNVLNVLSAMLHESRVILHSRSLSTLSAIAHTLLQLLYPFRWAYTFVSVLPIRALDVYLDTRPYIIGVHTKALKRMTAREGILWVDLDNNALRCNPTSAPPRLPVQAVALRDALMRLVERRVAARDVCGLFGHARAPALGCWPASGFSQGVRAADAEVRDGLGADADRWFDLAVQEAVLSFWSSLLQGFRRFVSYVDSQPFFNEQSFLAAFLLQQRAALAAGASMVLTPSELAFAKPQAPGSGSGPSYSSNSTSSGAAGSGSNSNSGGGGMPMSGRSMSERASGSTASGASAMPARSTVIASGSSNASSGAGAGASNTAPSPALRASFRSSNPSEYQSSSSTTPAASRLSSNSDAGAPNSLNVGVGGSTPRLTGSEGPSTEVLAPAVAEALSFLLQFIRSNAFQQFLSDDLESNLCHVSALCSQLARGDGLVQ